jgi:hypothetical protein
MIDLISAFKRVLNANSDEAINPFAIGMLKKMVASALVIKSSLTATKQSIVSDCFGDIDVLFETPIKAEMPAHPEMAAVRDGGRTLIKNMESHNTSVPTLVIGSTFREIHEHKANPNFHFSLYDSECKDENRIVSPMLASIGHILQTASRKIQDFVNISVQLTSRQVVETYADVNDLNHRIHRRVEETPGGICVETIRAEDCHYNWDWKDIDRIMTNTSAKRMLVYGVFPVELVSDECPDNNMYTMTSVGSQMRMTDKRGFANGYQHDKKRWSTLLREMGHNGPLQSYVSEIKFRAGPFCLIEINVTRRPGLIVRDITLLREEYVSVLDLLQDTKEPTKLSNLILGTRLDVTKRFLIPRSEWIQVLEYVQSLKELSLQSENIQSFIRRRRGGAALIDQLFVKSWTSRPEMHQSVIACALRVCYENRSRSVANAALLNKENPFKAIFRSLLSQVELPSYLAWFFEDERIFGEDICRTVDPVLRQYFEVKDRSLAGELKHSLNIQARAPEVFDNSQKTCAVCKEFYWLHKDCEDDLQTMVCTGCVETLPVHDYSMSTAEVTAFRNKLLPADGDPPGIAAVKNNARRKCPTTGFSVKVPYIIIDGGPGSGKSTQIRKKIKAGDAVWAPFSALMDDYEEPASDGSKIVFKTMHRIISDTVASDVIYTDETLSLPYEFIAVGANKAQPRLMVHFIGTKQTETLPSEGIPFSTKFTVRSQHFLLKNFRNTRACVNWMRDTRGIDMECAGNKPDGTPFNSDAPFYEYVDEDYVETNADKFAYIISPDMASVQIEEADRTVRQSQGRTNEVLLRITPGALSTFRVSCISLVAMTRSRGTVKILLVNGASKQIVDDILSTVHGYIARRPDQHKTKSLSKAVASIRACIADFERQAALERVGVLPPIEVTALPPPELDVFSGVDMSEYERSEEDDPVFEGDDADDDDTVDTLVNDGDVCEVCHKVGSFGNEFAFGKSTGEYRFCSEVHHDSWKSENSVSAQKAAAAPITVDEEEDEIQMVAISHGVSIVVPVSTGSEADSHEADDDDDDTSPLDSVSQALGLTPLQEAADIQRCVLDKVEMIRSIATHPKATDAMLLKVRPIYERLKRQFHDEVLVAARFASLLPSSHEFDDCDTEISCDFSVGSLTPPGSPESLAIPADLPSMIDDNGSQLSAGNTVHSDADFLRRLGAAARGQLVSQIMEEGFTLEEAEDEYQIMLEILEANH